MATQAAQRRGARLLVVSNMWPSSRHPVFGGFVSRNVDALRECGATVDVVANTDARTGVLRGTLKYVRLARDARRQARASDYDAVIGHYLYPTAGMAAAAARAAGARLVLVVHGTDSRSVHRTDPWAYAARRAVRSADLVVTVSRALARAVREGLKLSDDVPVAVVHMGIDEEVFVPDPSARNALDVPAHERVVLYVGNLARTKGLDVLQTAFQALVADGTADRLVVVGGGQLEAELREWADGDPQLRDRVVMTGRIEQGEVARWMAAADTLVLPSRNEGLGLVLIEAMACGTPCVASRVGGIPEVVRDDTGILVPPDDPAALASALAQVLERGRSSYHEACIRAARGHGSRDKAKEMLDAIAQL